MPQKSPKKSDMRNLKRNLNAAMKALRESEQDKADGLDREKMYVHANKGLAAQLKSQEELLSILSKQIIEMANDLGIPSTTEDELILASTVVTDKFREYKAGAAFSLEFLKELSTLADLDFFAPVTFEVIKLGLASRITEYRRQIADLMKEARDNRKNSNLVQLFAAQCLGNLCLHKVPEEAAARAYEYGKALARKFEWDIPTNAPGAVRSSAPTTGSASTSGGSSAVQSIAAKGSAMADPALKRTFKCPKCKKVVKWRSQLHLFNDAKDERTITMVCPNCGKSMIKTMPVKNDKV